MSQKGTQGWKQDKGAIPDRRDSSRQGGARKERITSVQWESGAWLPTGEGGNGPGPHGLVQWVFRAIKITKDLHRGVNKTKTYSRTTALENGLLRNRRSSPGLTVF